jgi:sigma-E factor negative regulatory protein RseC
MQCTGTILDGGNIARVYIESKGCDHCQACGFGAIREDKALEVNALNDIGASKGDRVHLEVSGKKVMSASAIIFLIPFGGFLLGFLLGFFLASPLGWHNGGPPLGLLLGLAGLAGSYYLVHLLGNKSEFEFIIKDFASQDEPLTPFESPSLR